MENQNRVGLADLYRQFHSLRAVSQFLKVSESTLRRRLLESGVQLNPRQLGGDEIAVKVRKSRRKPRPVKVIERVEARYEQPADVWGKEPWTETPPGKVEGEDKPAKTRGGGR